jgi:uncharacterized membrane protein
VAGGAVSLGGLAWAAAGGVVGGAGLILFYRGLAVGPMGVVAPLSAVVSTLLPVTVAFGMGERQRPTVYGGALVCLVAIVLLSMEGRKRDSTGARLGVSRVAVAYGLASGVAFGLFFLFLRTAGESGVFWPVTAARVAGTAVMLGAAAWRGTSIRGLLTKPRVLVAACLSGVLDASANLCYVLATRDGLFGLAVIITSLYPGMTVLLARLVLGERMRSLQRMGLMLAAAGVVLVTM